MTATTATLTEFLLARIAEDERDAKNLVETRDAGILRMHSGDMGGPREDDEYAALNIGAGRVLAECEAKRRIVEWHDSRDDECCEWIFGAFTVTPDAPLEAGADAHGGLTIRQEIGAQPYIGCVTLMHLAAVYADHPDYRDEWRP